MEETTAANGPVATTIASFKVCTLCGETWKSREAFLADPRVRVIGYQVHFQDLQTGMFLFNHDACCTTLAIDASLFTDLYQRTDVHGAKDRDRGLSGLLFAQGRAPSLPGGVRMRLRQGHPRQGRTLGESTATLSRSVWRRPFPDHLLLAPPPRGAARPKLL